MIRVVLDSNVIISALHFGGNPEKILNLANEGVIELIISPFILEEVTINLRKHFSWEEPKIKDALALMKEIATIVNPIHTISVIKAKDSDNRILECAVCGKADFLVSGDTKHITPLKQYMNITILKPAEFLAIKF